MFTPIPNYLSFLGKLQTVPYGSFATLIKELPVSDTCGFKKLDIIYAFNEQMPKSELSSFKEYYRKVSKYKKSKDIDEALNKDCQEEIKTHYRNYLNGRCNFFDHDVDLIYDIYNDKGITLRAFDHELNFSDISEDKETIEEAYDIVHFSIGNMSNWNTSLPSAISEPIKEIIWALMLDGFTETEAVKYMLDNNTIEKPNDLEIVNKHYSTSKKEIMENNIKKYYYRIKNEYYEALRHVGERR